LEDCSTLTVLPEGKVGVEGGAEDIAPELVTC